MRKPNPSNYIRPLFFARDWRYHETPCLDIFANEIFNVIGKGAVFLGGRLQCKNLEAGIKAKSR